MSAQDIHPPVRMYFICDLRRRGLTLAQIGAAVGLTRERVRQLLVKAQRQAINRRSERPTGNMDPERRRPLNEILLDAEVLRCERKLAEAKAAEVRSRHYLRRQAELLDRRKQSTKDAARDLSRARTARAGHSSCAR